MTVDLLCLVLNAFWGLALVMIEIQGKTRVGGPAWNMGNREKDPEVPPWVLRAGRALGNHKENFPLFLTVVVVVHLVHQNDRVSAMASIAYVIARFLHGAIYLAGITKLRTFAFLAGLASVFVIASRLVL
jgi:uncharacterized MAPEG superfamily protein